MRCEAKGLRVNNVDGKSESETLDGQEVARIAS